MGISAAFIGAILIIRPGTSVMTTTSLFPLLGGVGFTVYALETQFLYSNFLWSYLFLNGFVSMYFYSIVVPFLWQPIALNEVPIIAALVGFGILGHLLMIGTFATATASNIAPYGCAGLLFNIIFGFTFLYETPDLITLLGLIVIVGAGLSFWYRERLTQAQKNHG